MSDLQKCPKRERMSVIRSDRRDAGFCEVTVWVPHKFQRAVRDLAWRIIDWSPFEFPHRGAPRSDASDGADLTELSQIIHAPSAKAAGRDEGKVST